MSDNNRPRLHLYSAFIDDGRSCMAVSVPGYDEDHVREYLAEGGEEVLAVKDVTDRKHIDGTKIWNALKDAEISEEDIYFVMRALEVTRVIDEF